MADVAGVAGQRGPAGEHVSALFHSGSFPPGLDVAATVMKALGTEAEALTDWMRRSQAFGAAEPALAAA